MENPIVLKGFCCYSHEQGVEQGLYAFQNVKSDRKSMQILKNGDRLTILDKRNSRKIIWSGFISLWQDRIGRINQRGVPRKRWVRWFRKKYPAELTPFPN